MTTYFTADHHFNHSKILEWRPEFQTVSEMNQSLVEIHNSIVGPEDTVWFLGDIGWNDAKSLPLIESMNGKLKNLIWGNHDSKKLRRWPLWNLSIEHWATVHRGKTLFLQHKPSTTFKTGVHLCGHSHGQHKISTPNVYDVGVDCWEYRPVTLGEILAKGEFGI